MQRSIAGILAVFNVINGLAMLFAGSTWWVTVPGVPDTGPYNPHFVQDVGAAFLAAGLALAVRAWRPRYWPAAMAGAGFLAMHAAIHLVMIAGGHDHHAAADFATVIVPAALALYSALPTKETKQMRKFIARRILRSFSKRYGYDTSYMETMLKESPAAFFKFAPVMKGGRPSRGDPAGRKLRRQDHRRNGRGLRSLHPDVCRHGAGGWSGEGPDRGRATP